MSDQTSILPNPESVLAEWKNEMNSLVEFVLREVQRDLYHQFFSTIQKESGLPKFRRFYIRVSHTRVLTEQEESFLNEAVKQKLAPELNDGCWEYEMTFVTKQGENRSKIIEVVICYRNPYDQENTKAA